MQIQHEIMWRGCLQEWEALNPSKQVTSTMPIEIDDEESSQVQEMPIEIDDDSEFLQVQDET